MNGLYCDQWAAVAHAIFESHVWADYGGENGLRSVMRDYGGNISAEEKAELYLLALDKTGSLRVLKTLYQNLSECFSFREPSPTEQTKINASVRKFTDLLSRYPVRPFNDPICVWEFYRAVEFTAQYADDPELHVRFMQLLASRSEEWVSDYFDHIPDQQKYEVAQLYLQHEDDDALEDWMETHDEKGRGSVTFR